MNQPTEFKIRTLRDIFNLPEFDQMERCLKELTSVMISTRATVELYANVARSVAKEDGVELPPGKLHEWPEEALWRDDKGGTSEITIPSGVQGEDLKLELQHAKTSVTA